MENPFSIKTAFSVHEAAAAIHGITRLHRDDLPVLQPICNELFYAIRTKELSAHVPQKATAWRDGRATSVRPDYSNATIDRHDLRAWCEARGIRPALLFPESPKADPPLHARERDALLKIIRALAELHGIKPDSGACRKEAVALLAELAEKGIAAPCEEKTMAKHLSASFAAR